MCMISVVMEQYQPWPSPDPNVINTWINGVSREEFDRLRAEVEELRALVQAAARFDEATGQPDCKNEEKFALLKTLADALGVDLQEAVAR